ncbi:four-carbon acid sugar kinase family protein [Catalinimonas niigatensis]|uniref:four-carbon acid sugar kinase family protein n=1 Tax=Catalinimonas niigatensis TaxID=1397264 RepID=UPI002664FD77|nr:four-carbon acid sugar kinase family protein [Catalinimonas niigatensis]WPP50952.1 four-carbon acid sugar kinase family protein [Catalinimonas niigatensis]
MSNQPNLAPMLLSYYGDDFTGSSDVMEALALNGIPTALFLKPPTIEELESFELKNKVSGEQTHLQAFGVAGISRSLTPGEMDRELPYIFSRISKIPTQFFHYKVCSTFDSSPGIGSIGHAVDIAYHYFPSDYIPMLIGAPSLNRYCIFGNLFARVEDTTYRLDRHPTMSKHPVTPMGESDLRLHLARQTSRKVYLMDLFSLGLGEEERQQKFENLLSEKGNLVLFDTYDEKHLQNIGCLIYNNRLHSSQLLVGSSGIEYALCHAWQDKGDLQKPPDPPSPGKSDQLIVVGGSCAPPTQAQLEWAIQKGFADIRLDAVKLVIPNESEDEVIRVKSLMLNALEEGKSLVMYTALGPDDPSIKATAERMKACGREDIPSSAILAGTQGRLVKEVLEITGKKRLVVAGGDTSGYVSRALGIYALETLMPIAPGAPLCTAHSHNPQFDGLEICLKGGQNGKANFFESILYGKDISTSF